jgi:RimJ/RimL family protein N-acetyltransferase
LGLTRLVTRRLTLAPPTEADADFVLALLNDRGWIDNIGDRGVHDRDAAAAYIRDRFAGDRWFVARDAAGEPLGLAGLVVRDGLDCADVGYAFLERHAGQGYATEAAAAVLRHGLETLGLPKLCAITTPHNRASQRVLEKIGLNYVDTRQVTGVAGLSAYYETP